MIQALRFVQHISDAVSLYVEKIFAVMTFCGGSDGFSSHQRILEKVQRITPQMRFFSLVSGYQLLHSNSTLSAKHQSTVAQRAETSGLALPDEFSVSSFP